MFGFLRRSAPRPLSDAIRDAIKKDGMTPAVSSQSGLQMVDVGGHYSNRKVTYFRVFDPTSTTRQTLDIRRYKDFDALPALVLRSGHVEQDGTVILTRPANIVAAQPAAIRTRAGRAVADVAVTVVDGEAVTSGTLTADVTATVPST